MNAMYSFHASAAAYMEFVQESVQTIAACSQLNLELWDGLSIDEVTKEAFELLGENGIICAADKHACSECTQEYKRTADIITGDDPVQWLEIIKIE